MKEAGTLKSVGVGVFIGALLCVCAFYLIEHKKHNEVQRLIEIHAGLQQLEELKEKPSTPSPNKYYGFDENCQLIDASNGKPVVEKTTLEKGSRIYGDIACFKNLRGEK